MLSGTKAPPDTELEQSRRLLQGGLDALPDARQRRMVALRTALRALPGIFEVTDGVWEWAHEPGRQLILHSMRLVFMHWVDLTYGGVAAEALATAEADLRRLLDGFDADIPDFYQRNIMGSDYGCAAMQDHTEAGRRAVALVEAVSTLTYLPQQFDLKFPRYASLLATHAFFGPNGRDFNERWRAAQGEAHLADCARVRERDHATFILSPLWPSPESAAFATNVQQRELLMDFEEHGFRSKTGYHLQLWLRERKDGALVLGLPPAASRERMVRAANLPALFWTGRPAPETYKAFDYLLNGALDNPHWGAC